MSEARDEVRRSFELERVKLQQEVEQLRVGKRKSEEALGAALQADKIKAAELRSSQQLHRDELARVRRECDREIRRLLDELQGKERAVGELEKELGVEETRRVAGMCGSPVSPLAGGRRSDTGRGRRTGCQAAGEPHEIPKGSPEQQIGEKAARRFQLKIGELNAVVRKLEDRNTLLADERNELLRQLRENDAQCRPLMERTHRLNRQNEEFKKRLQRADDKLRFLTRENTEMKQRFAAREAIRRPSSLNDLDRSHEQQEIDFLRLQVVEQQNIIEDLNREREKLLRKMKPLRKDFRAVRRPAVETSFGYDDDGSLDSDASSLSCLTDRTPGTPEDETDDFTGREESELHFQQLMREYQALQRAYALLQEQLGGEMDVERETKIRERLRCELNRYQEKVQDLQKALLDQGKGHEMKCIEEKQELHQRNRELQDKIWRTEGESARVWRELQDVREQNELLEFRILELEERERTSPTLILAPLPCPQGGGPLQKFCIAEGMTEVSIPELLKTLDILGDNGNLSNNEQVTVIHARVILTLAEKFLKQIEGTETALQQKMVDLEKDKELFIKQKGYLEEELDYRKQTLDQAQMRVLELEAILYMVLCQGTTEVPPGIELELWGKGAEGGRVRQLALSECERERLQASAERWQRAVLGRVRQHDAQLLRQRNQLLQHTMQRIRELEDILDRQKRKMKDIEEKGEFSMWRSLWLFGALHVLEKRLSFKIYRPKHKIVTVYIQFT
uniref:Janus kinase and microtubule-interacting protein C-terminal domain-containing protein n=1 Tax=Eptatretus burgeri TaxID=7764 RepID=A0A8C4QU53_EPTBU